MPRPPCPRFPALALLLALGGAARAAEPAPDAGRGRVAVFTAAGTVDGAVHAGRLTLSTAAGPLPLRLDRDTAIFLPDRVGTARDLQAGAQVRVAYGADQLAYWIEVGAPPHPTGRDEAPPPQPAPVSLAPPPGGAAPAEAAPARAGEGADGLAPGQAVPAGPPAPEPNPGAQPPRPGGAGPTPPAGPLRGP